MTKTKENKMSDTELELEEPEIEEVKLVTKVTAASVSSSYERAVKLVDLFALMSEARAQAARVGWETAILDPIEEVFRKLKG